MRSTKKSFASTDNSAASQRQRILQHLQTIGPLTTLQARHLLDTMHPGMRICELRKAGHPIITFWTDDLTPEGHSHRVARYVLDKSRQMSLWDMISDATEQIQRKR